MLVVGVPLALLGPNGLTQGGAAEESIDVERTFTIGVPGLLDGIATLNPNQYTMSAEWMAVFPCYSKLLQYDEDSQIIGDLARSWSVSPDGLTWHFELVDNAYFVDPNDPTDTSHQVTSEDVIFTYQSIQDEPGSNLNYLLPGIISSMWLEGPFDVHISINRPYAPFLNSLLNIPILPKYIWETQDFVRYDNLPPIGSGPFYYANDDLPETEVVLKRNPTWFMTEQ